MNILVTGATGFVGSKLIEELVNEGHHVYALTRSQGKVKSSKVKWLKGDLLHPGELPVIPALDKAFYLVHGLKGESESFEYFEATAAVNFINWIRPLSPHVIYLGGIVPKEGALSPHLRSRVLTGAILGSSGLPVTEFRASIVLGEGSLSFEMVKAIAERFPFIPELNLLSRQCQPLAESDLMSYLVASLERSPIGHEIIELGGPEKASYGDLLELYARVQNLKRKRVKIPEVEPRVLMKALDYSIPEHARIGRKLAESLEHATVVSDERAMKEFPSIEPMSLEEAMRRAAGASQTHYPPLWEKDFLKLILSDKVLSQSGLLSPELLRNLEKVGKIRDLFSRRNK